MWIEVPGLRHELAYSKINDPTPRTCHLTDTRLTSLNTEDSTGLTHSQSMENLSYAVIDTEGNFTEDDFDDYLSTTVPFVVILFLLIVATIISNSVVFFAVYAFRELRTVTNCFVVSLATADIAVALLAMPVWLMTSLLVLDSDGFLLFELSTKWIDVFCCTASILNATLVSLDRYLAIIKPLRYKVVVTRRRANKAIAVVWCLSVFVAAMSFLQFRGNTSIHAWAIFLFISILCIPLSIMAFSYFCIYRAAIAQLSKMTSTRLNTHLGQEDTTKNYAKVRRKRFYQELRITRTLSVIVGLFVLAWAPYLIMVMVETFYPYLEVPLPIQGITVWLPYLNSCVNPWVFTGMNKDFRKAFKTLVCGTHNTCFCLPNSSTQRRERPSRSQGTSLLDESALATMSTVQRSRRDGGSILGSHGRELDCTSV